MSKTHVSIPVELLPEFEAWGKTTAELFGKLRQKAGLPPKDVPEDQAWFWTEEWQAMEREADEDVKAGRYKRFESVDELIADLNSPI
jgi:hypothetical protein